MAGPTDPAVLLRFNPKECLQVHHKLFKKVSSAGEIFG